MRSASLLVLLLTFVVLDAYRVVLDAVPGLSSLHMPVDNVTPVAALQLEGSSMTSSRNSTEPPKIHAQSAVRGPVLDSCPRKLVKRCRFCNYNEGCGTCFRVSDGNSARGVICRKAKLSSKCTGDGITGSGQECSLDAIVHPGLQASWETAKKNNPNGAEISLWDSIYLRYKMCQELQHPNTEGYYASDVVGHDKFWEVRRQDHVEDRMKAELGCHDNWEEDVDLSKPVVKFPPQPRGRKSLFDDHLPCPWPNEGKSGAETFLSKGKLFRVKLVMDREKEFWNTKIGSMLLEHWLRPRKSTFGKMYGVVDVSAKEETSLSLSGWTRNSKYYFLSLDAFGGKGPDDDKREGAQRFDLKGSGRTSRNGDFVKKEVSIVEQYPYGFSLPGWPKEGVKSQFQEFMLTLLEDIRVLEEARVHDHSLVVRITPQAKDCPCYDQKRCANADDALEQWNQADPWKNIETSICVMNPQKVEEGEAFIGDSVEMGAVLIDYLQDSTTVRNKLAGVFSSGCSRVDGERYGFRLMSFLCGQSKLEGKRMPGSKLVTFGNAWLDKSFNYLRWKGKDETTYGGFRPFLFNAQWKANRNVSFYPSANQSEQMLPRLEPSEPTRVVIIDYSGAKATKHPARDKHH